MAKKKTKSAAKKKPVKKASAKKVAAKKPVKKQSTAKKTPKKTTAEKTAKENSDKAKPSAKALVSRSSDATEKKNTPIVFSLDDVEELVAAKKKTKPAEAEKKAAAPAPTPVKKTKAVVEDQPTEKRVLGAASLADILGFNPGEKKRNTQLGEEEIPRKGKKYYNLLIELRKHVRDELDLHTADTLKHSSREDSGDLASYGNHQADAGTDTFDRDFALSLVSNEQDALNEIEEAILRIRNGTYGVCEVTGKPIPKERLTAVPFARFSVEGQSEYEKNKRRKTGRASGAGGLFGDGTEAPKISSDDDEEE
jgi:RNA polymerase-binding transcription factor DksA